MHLDVAVLDRFYRQSALGQMGRRTITRALRDLWPNVRNCDVAGVGFATHLLRPFLEEASSVTALMPAGQGVLPWPPEGPNATLLYEEGLWPLPDCCLDRLVLVHAIETTPDPIALMDEAWRVLRGEGKLAVIVVNRMSPWAWTDRTPLGHGRPFSKGQIERLLSDHGFLTLECQHVLHLPPTHQRFLLRSAGLFEGAGKRLWKRGSALLILEAQKRQLAMRPRAKLRIAELLPGLLPRPASPRAARDTAQKAALEQGLTPTAKPPLARAETGRRHEGAGAPVINLDHARLGRPR